jgi:Mrp family chromosome partitioning ATPase
MITSPAATEGKSTLTSNLAIAMAMAKERVLVIDADFRNRLSTESFASAVT